ncbi:NAD(P)H-binding protein [Variovorax sp. RCC_210]|uniref:NAD(P)H-binding protein n=1 Tax=Variovorax sp. RCC_210 TaxID=3239217 RepID=UPI00352698EA
MTSIDSTSTGGALLVSGGSGALARQVIELLLRHRPRVPLIASTRQPRQLDDLAARGVSVRFADFDQPGSLDAAFAGATRMLLVSTNTPDAPPRRVTQHGNAIEAARRCGVQHVVYTSFATAGVAKPGPVAADHAATEQVLREGQAGFSILRNAFYAELLLATLPLARRSGRLPCAPGRGRMTLVARADCAAAAAAALVDGFDGRRVLSVAGEEALDAHALASMASEVLGTPIEAVETMPDQLEAAWLACGASPGMARVFAGMDRSTASGDMEIPGSDLRELLRALPGRAPTGMRAFLQAHRAVILGA